MFMNPTERRLTNTHTKSDIYNETNLLNTYTIMQDSETMKIYIHTHTHMCTK